MKMIYGTNYIQLNGLADTEKMVSHDIKIDISLDRFAKATFNRGKKVATEGTQLINKSVI